MSCFLPAGVCNNLEVLSRLWLLWIKCYFDLLNSNLNVLVSKCACHCVFYVASVMQLTKCFPMQTFKHLLTNSVPFLYCAMNGI